MPRTLSFAQLQEGLRAGTIHPVYLLDGEEGYFHEEAIRLLTGAAVTPDTIAMNRDLVRGEELTLAALLDRAETYPMGEGRRLIVIRDADALRAEGAEPLIAYLGKPNPRACLVFSDVKFDRRRIVYRALAERAVRVDCAPLDESRLVSFVRERLRGRGFGIGADLAAAIASGLAGAGLARLDAELEKLMSSIGEPRPVAAADLSILSDVPRVDDAFRLARHALRGERGEAIGLLRSLLGEGEDAVKILGGISWYVRNALRARLAEDRRLPPRETTLLYNIDRGRIERFCREVGAAPAEALQGALGLCLRADRELKGMGAKDPAHALERLVHHARRRPGRAA